MVAQRSNHVGEWVAFFPVIFRLFCRPGYRSVPAQHLGICSHHRKQERLLHDHRRRATSAEWHARGHEWTVAAACFRNVRERGPELASRAWLLPGRRFSRKELLIE